MVDNEQLKYMISLGKIHGISKKTQKKAKSKDFENIWTNSKNFIFNKPPLAKEISLNNKDLILTMENNLEINENLNLGCQFGQNSFTKGYKLNENQILCEVDEKESESSVKISYNGIDYEDVQIGNQSALIICAAGVGILLIFAFIALIMKKIKKQ